MNIRSIALASMAVVGLADGVSRAAPYLWVGSANADWLTAGNWSGSSSFANDASNVCDVNAGGQPDITTSAASFLGQINLNAGSTLKQRNYMGTSTVGALRLNGGQLNIGSADTFKATNGIVVSAASVINAAGGDNASLNAVLGGNGDLAITNSQPSNRNFSMTLGNSSAYAGLCTLGGTGAYNINGSLGGTVHISSTVLAVTVNSSKSTYGNSIANWDLDMNGKTLSFGSENNEQSGQVTLLSPATIKSVTDYGGKTTTLSGKITGTGKLTLNSAMTRDASVLALIVSGNTNDYSGGTEIIGTVQAKSSHSLGTGDVQVDAGAKLMVDASDVMSSAASLYLDYNSTTTKYGVLNLASGTTTTVANAYIGGLGGWAGPAGYTPLAPGTYTSANLANHITGAGTLLVLPEPATLTMLAVCGLAMLRRRTR